MEVARRRDGGAAVRDSKADAASDLLLFDDDGWRAFVVAVRHRRDEP